MKATYILEYYLPNQSHLLSEPKRVAVKGEDAMREKVAIAQKHGYDLIAVYEEQGEGYFVPVNIGIKKYKVIMRSGTVKHDLFVQRSYEEAQEICEDYGWQFAPDGEGSFVWDLEIEQED